MLDPEGSAYMRQSLYKRLGGYDTIAVFVHHLMARLRSDATLAVYWKGISDDSAHRGDQLLIDYICAVFEGPVYYMGRDMKLSHKGLGISEAEWDIFMTHVAATLDSIGVAARESAEFLQCTDGLKWDIVEAPAAPVR